jgi:hypothetical protein
MMRCLVAGLLVALASCGSSGPGSLQGAGAFTVVKVSAFSNPGITDGGIPDSGPNVSIGSPSDSGSFVQILFLGQCSLMTNGSVVDVFTLFISNPDGGPIGTGTFPLNPGSVTLTEAGWAYVGSFSTTVNGQSLSGSFSTSAPNQCACTQLPGGETECPYN